MFIVLIVVIVSWIYAYYILNKLYTLICAVYWMSIYYLPRFLDSLINRN